MTAAGPRRKESRASETRFSPRPAGRRADFVRRIRAQDSDRKHCRRAGKSLGNSMARDFAMQSPTMAGREWLLLVTLSLLWGGSYPRRAQRAGPGQSL